MTLVRCGMRKGTHLGIWGLKRSWASLVAQMVKNPPEMQEIWVQSLDREDPLGYPLQYSCLENSMDRGAWGAIVHGVTKSRTQLSD